MLGDRERRHRHRLMVPAVGAWASTAVGTLVAPSTAVMAAVAAGAVAALVGRRCVVVSLLTLGVGLGAASAAWHVHSLRSGVIATMAGRRADVDVVGHLVRDPLTITTASGGRMTLVDVTVTSVLVRGWQSASAPVLVLSYARGWQGLLPGQRVELTARLEPPRRGDDVAAVLDARGPPVTIGHPPWWQRGAGRVRAALAAACSHLPADERGLLPGLVDGDVSAEPADLTADMRLTGLTHLQAVSGENVSVVLAVTLGVARAVGLRRRARLVLTGFALAGFVVLARPSPSVLRAAVMGSIALLGVALGRKVAALSALSAAIVVLVCVDPFLARSVGFALSVCATAAILTVAPGWTTALSHRMPRWLATAIAVPAAAQLACTPILVLAFGQLTPYAVLANLLAAPAVVPATVLGVACAVVSTASVGLAVPVAWLAAVPAGAIALIARTAAAFPGAGVRWPGGAALDVAVVTLALAAALAFATRARRSAGRAILGTWRP